MEDENNCLKCSQRIEANDDCFVVCKGNCAGSFHCICVGLRGIHWKTIKDLSRNVLWMCDGCMDDFMLRKNDHSSEIVATTQTKTIDEEVNELKIAVASIIDTIATITKTVPARSATNSECLQSTSRSTIFNGTACEEEDTTTKEDGSRYSDDEDNFSLLLTNINSSCTERDIQWMVARALGLLDPERINVTKLVSKWKSHLNLDIISFKVILHSELKLRALSPTT